MMILLSEEESREYEFLKALNDERARDNRTMAEFQYLKTCRYLDNLRQVYNELSKNLPEEKRLDTKLTRMNLESDHRSFEEFRSLQPDFYQRRLRESHKQTEEPRKENKS